jgi:hypothetical protein
MNPVTPILCSLSLLKIKAHTHHAGHRNGRRQVVLRLLMLADGFVRW